MPRVWKDIFRAGTYLDHSGTPHKFTPTDVVNAYRNGRAMLRHRIPLSPPTIWEHDWQSVPERLSSFLSRIGSDRDRRADEAKNAFGWAADFKLTYEADPRAAGQTRPVLHAQFEVPDDADLNQLRKTRFVSPRVDWDFRDTLGRTWKGCSVTHIAATHSPVQIDQRPLMLGQQPSSKTLFLGAPMADDAKKPETPAGGGSDITGRLKAICEAMNWPVSEAATSPEDVLLIMESHSQKQTDGTQDDDNGDTSPASSVTPTMLSTLPDGERELVEKELKKAAVVENRDRGQLLARFRKIEKPVAERHIFGDNTPQRLKDLERRITGVNLSYTPEGELVTNGVMRELETLEAAVRSNAPTTPGKKPLPKPVNMDGLGGGNDPVRVPQKPGDPGWEEEIRRITDERNARYTRKVA